MLAGQDTFINHLLNKCGLTNGFEEENSRYNEITMDQIAELNLDYIFLSSEPYPFKEKHSVELQQYTNAKVVLVDGEMFSWYGNRLENFKNYFITDLSIKLV